MRLKWLLDYKLKMKNSDSKIGPRAQTRINPAWVTAEYDLDFLICGVPQHFYALSRKRARHQIRQLLRYYRTRRLPPVFLFRRRWLNYK